MKKLTIDAKVSVNGKKSIVKMDKPVEIYSKVGVDSKIKSTKEEAITAANEYTDTNYSKVGDTAPLSATDTGTVGEIRVTATYIYTCVATNTWVRAAVATW